MRIWDSRKTVVASAAAGVGDATVAVVVAVMWFLLSEYAKRRTLCFAITEAEGGQSQHSLIGF